MLPGVDKVRVTCPDITAIHARIFHHKPALQGHINYFVKEFEDRRGEREGLRINSTFKNISYINDQGLPNAVTALSETLADLKKEADAAANLCKEICEKEGVTSEEGEASFLIKEREKRQKEWAEFIELQCERSATVDEEYENQIEALKKHYSELESKLQSSTKVL